MRKLISLIIICTFVLLGPLANAAELKNWTILIFMNGNNDLDIFSKRNLIDLEKIGSTQKVNVVVQWASLATKQTKRLLIKKSNNPNKVTSPILQKLGVVDMGDYLNLEDFVTWGVQHFPAEHYFIVVWNHGSGWRDTASRLRSVIASRERNNTVLGDISYDEISNNIITTEQLGEAMKYAASVIGHKVDLYASDACLMAMAEIANELSDSVSYYAGSQELEPGEGWPYADLLARIVAKPEAGPDEIAKILVEEYVKSYQNGSNGNQEVTYSAFDLTKLSDFDAAMATLSLDIRHLDANEKATVLKTIRKTQHFGSPDYRDLIDFVENLSAANLSGIPAKTLADLKIAANNLVIANAATDSYYKAKGVSIWLPVSPKVYQQYQARYLHLHFNQQTQWRAALGYLHQQ